MSYYKREEFKTDISKFPSVLFASSKGSVIKNDIIKSVKEWSMKERESVCGDCKNFGDCEARHLNEVISQRPVTWCDFKETTGGER